MSRKKYIIFVADNVRALTSQGPLDFVHTRYTDVTLALILHSFRLFCFVNVHNGEGKVFRIGTVRYNWLMSAHASQAFSIAHCTDSEDLPGEERDKC